MSCHRWDVISITKKTAGATALALSLFATGCATLPNELPDVQASAADARSVATQDWNATPALTTQALTLPTTLADAQPLPARIANRKVDLELPQDAKVARLAALINALGISTVIVSGDLDDQMVGVTHYHGTLGGLLDAISAVQPISFTWRGGVLAIATGIPMIAYLPQNEELIKQVSADLANLGATDITASQAAGSLVFDAPGGKAWRIERYIRRVANNASTVALQIAVVTVGLTKNHSTGLDWSRLQLTFGHGLSFDNTGGAGQNDGGIVPLNPIGGNRGNSNSQGDDSGDDSGSGSDSGSGGDSGTGSGTDSDSASTVGAQLASQSLGFVANGFDFNMKAMFSLLSSYGTTRTTQNLVLRTLSGQEVKIRSGETVPYVSGVSVNSTNNGNLLGGTQTETVETGLTLKITPQYNARSRLVTMDVDLSMKSIVGFLQLNAGEQVGTLSRPDVQDQSLETVARAAAGQTVVLGGLIYDQMSDNRNTLAGLENLPVGHKENQIQRNALFIIIRPTVTTYAFTDS